VELTCYRDQEVKRELRQLPAASYNLAHPLLERSTNENLFIPIRSMQYFAIMDKEEIIFLDGERKCWIDISWQKFHPQARNSLDEAVEYTAIYYRKNTEQLMSRLQAEFPRALKELAQKSKLEGSARVLKFPAPVNK
jgi:hypothetical protein